MPTVGSIIINDALPPELRNYNRVLDKHGIKQLLGDVARNNPDKYQEILGKLGRLGAQFAQRSGGYSFATDILQTPELTKQHRAQLQKQLKIVYNDDKLSNKEKDTLITKIMSEGAENLRNKLYEHLTEVESPVALMARSGAKGNPVAVSAGMGFDGLYTSNDDSPVPFPVLKNYSEGLNPFEYWASSFGARRGVVDTKLNVASAGFLSKQLVQVAHKGVISADDYKDNNFRANVGLPTTTDDNDNIGRYLANPVGGYKRNTLITDSVLKDLQNKKINDILVRSPIVAGPADGSLYGRDVGQSEKGRSYVSGENPGITAVQALSEPLSQGMLSSKHTGGVYSGSAKTISGFKNINNMLQVPSTWEGASHSQEDGKVTDIKTDELGNTIVTINGQEHIVPHTNKVTVKKGDEIEAGDVISDGLPNPAEVVHYKGIGEGRRYFVQAFNDVLKQTGINTTKRNVELLAHGLIDHIKINEEHNDYLPDDIVSYAKYESDYEPREGSVRGKPQFAANQYLEEPILHYTIGTKIRPSVINNLKKFGIENIVTHKEPPKFQSNMVRAMDNVSVSDDWLTRMGGAYQKRSILEAAQKGMEANPFGPSFYSAIVGRTDFTKRRTGQPEPVIKSILPNLPQKQISMPTNDMDPEDMNWFDTDG